MPVRDSKGWARGGQPATSAAVVLRLNQAINAVLVLPDVKQRLNDVGVDIVGGTPDAFAARLRREFEVYGKAMGQATRRLDVDTKGLDSQAAKDVLSLEEFRRFQNFTEDKCNNLWFPGIKLAEAVLK